VTMRLSCTVMEICHLKYWTHGPGHKKKNRRMERVRGMERKREGKKVEQKEGKEEGGKNKK